MSKSIELYLFISAVQKSIQKAYKIFRQAYIQSRVSVLFYVLLYKAYRTFFKIRSVEIF